MQAIRTRVPQIIPHVKPDHGLEGRMLKDTAYGFVDPKDGILVTRKAVDALTAAEVGAIRDPELKRLALAHLPPGKPSASELKAALSAFSQQTGVKRVRICVKDQTVKPVQSAPYKGYKTDSFACCDVWRIPPKKKGGNASFKGIFWSYQDTANGKPNAEDRRPHPAAKYLMRLFKQDVVALGPVQNPTIFKVFGFSTTNNRLDVSPVERNREKRNFVSINKLGADGLRRLYISIDGRILKDPGGFQ